jgi:hypothetical protein
MTPDFHRVAGRKAGKARSRLNFRHKKTACPGGFSAGLRRNTANGDLHDTRKICF